MVSVGIGLKVKNTIFGFIEGGSIYCLPIAGIKFSIFSTQSGVSKQTWVKG
jgi:hypothetical protein